MNEPQNSLYAFYLKKFRWKYSMGLGALLVVDVLDWVSPLVLMMAVDNITARLKGEPGGSHSLWYWGVLYLVIQSSMGVFRWVWREGFISTSHRVDRHLKRTFFRRLLTYSPAFFQRHPTGDIMSRATNDMETTRLALGVGFLIFLDAIFFLVGVPPILLYLDWKLALLVFLPAPLLPFFMFRMGRLIDTRSTAAQESFSGMSEAVQEAVSGIRVLKGYAQEPLARQRFEAASDKYLDENIRLAWLNATFMPVLEFTTAISTILLIFSGGISVVQGTMTLGTFIAFRQYITKLVWPMTALGWSLNLHHRGRASSRRILSVMEEKPDVRDPLPEAVLEQERTGIIPPEDLLVFDQNRYEKLRGEIEFRNLTFGYSPNGPPVLDRISLKVPAGSCVAFVGRIGSGKTSLLNLLPHLYPVKRGELQLDGRDINDVPLKQLRGSIGMVPQDPFLFSDTIEKNVLLGIDAHEPVPEGLSREGPDRADTRVIDAVKRAHIEGEIARIPNGYRAMLGERGINLSGGQKQRLTIARALLRDPSILIFDDTLSAVDASTEREILGEIRSAIRGRTSILVSHRLSTVQQADRIYFLENGRIAEQGTHDELIALGGRYLELYRRQQIEEKLEVA